MSGVYVRGVSVWHADEDDIMICQCKPIYRGGDGCGPDCINRMLCIECVSVSGFAGTEAWGAALRQGCCWEHGARPH